MVNMEEFIAQITPLIILMIVFPAAIMIFYFTIVRPYIRNRDKARQPAESKSKTTPAGPSALDMLRQAQAEEAMDEVVAAEAISSPVASRNLDTGDLPDLGMLLNSSTLKKEMPAVPAPTPSAAPKAPAVRQMLDTPLPLKLNTGETTRAKEMLTVLRDENDGRLMVQIGATGYRSLLDSPEAKKLFTSLMKELSSSIMTPDARPVVADEAPPAPAPRSSSLDALRGLSEPVPAPKPAPVMSEPRRTAPPPPLADGTMPGALPSYKFDDNPAKVTLRRDGTVKKVDFVPPPTVDIPSAIEAYLQYKIEYTPEYQGLGIHIRSGVGGGVRIQVGNLYYDAVDDVEDPNVRAFLKEAIAEWQERQ